MAELWDQMPSDNDTCKAFAGAALGAAKSRGSEMDKAIRRYNDALVKWKNTPHHQDRQRVNMRHIKPAFGDLHRTFNGEMQRIASRKRPSNPERRALRNRRRATRYLRYERNSLHLNNIADIQRFRKFLKAANFAGWSAIIIDVGLATQKVDLARQTGGNSTRIAYEEYIALAAGVAGASVLVGAAIAFIGPGLIVLTLNNKKAVTRACPAMQTRNDLPPARSCLSWGFR